MQKSSIVSTTTKSFMIFEQINLLGILKEQSLAKQQHVHAATIHTMFTCSCFKQINFPFSFFLIHIHPHHTYMYN